MWSNRGAPAGSAIAPRASPNYHISPNQPQPSVRSARLRDDTTDPGDLHAPPPSPRGRKPARERLDTLLVRRGLAPSRERARALIMAGSVRVNGRAASKAGEQTPEDADLALAEQ